MADLKENKINYIVKQKRLEIGMSLESVSLKTGIPLDVLEFFESQDCLDGNSDTIFKEVVKCLGLEQNDILKESLEASKAILKNRQKSKDFNSDYAQDFIDFIEDVEKLL